MQNNDTTQEFLAKGLPVIRKAAGPDKIDYTLKKHGLDVIIAPTDSQITAVAALAGKLHLFQKYTDKTLTT